MLQTAAWLRRHIAQSSRAAIVLQSATRMYSAAMHKPRSRSPTPDTSLGSVVPGDMPDFRSWSLAELRAEAAFHSLRKSGTKPTLIKQLEAVWQQRLANSDDRSVQSEDASVEILSVTPSAAPPAPKRRGKGKGKAAPNAAAAPAARPVEEEAITISDSDDPKSPSPPAESASPARRRRRSPSPMRSRKTKTSKEVVAVLDDTSFGASTSGEMERAMATRLQLGGDEEEQTVTETLAVSSDSDSSAEIALAVETGVSPKASKKKKQNPQTKATTKPKNKGAKRGKGAGSASGTGSEDGSDAEVSEEEEVEAVALPDLTPQNSILLKKAIRSDQQLWRRILLMEPIPLDEFISVANRPLPPGGAFSAPDPTSMGSKKLYGAGLAIKTGKQRLSLRTWLEMQGICTFMDELTGPRKRR